MDLALDHLLAVPSRQDQTVAAVGALGRSPRGGQPQFARATGSLPSILSSTARFRAQPLPEAVLEGD